MGLPYHSEDFGQTLAVWGVPAGPYVVLPLLGPSNVRDAAGLTVDHVLDPFNMAARADGAPDSLEHLGLVRLSVGALDARARTVEQTDAIRRTSVDYYAALRSLYRQLRENAIRNGAPGPGGSDADTAENESFDFDDIDETSETK